MSSISKILSMAVLSVVTVFAQSIPSYSSYEEYCQKNPNAPTCRDGKPLDVQKDMQKVWDGSLQGYCQKNPDSLMCGGNGDKQQSKPRPARAPHAIQASQPNQAPVTPTTSYRMPAPGSRAARSDIRLGELDWRIIPKDADMLIGINMASLTESELAGALIREWSTRLGVTQVEQEALMATLGSVSQVVVSVHGKEILAALIGRVDDLQEGAQVGNFRVARLSADTIVMSDAWNLTWVRHRLHFPLDNAAALEEGQQLARTYHFWACAKPSAMAAFGQKSDPNSPVRKVRFGVSLDKGFRMDMFLDTIGPEAAQHVLATSSKGAPRDLQSFVEGNTVHYVLALDKTQALARFAPVISDSTGKQFAQLLAAARELSRRTPGTARSSPGKVIIEGLDDGPREVAIPPKK
jgi:hypothetical protein